MILSSSTHVITKIKKPTKALFFKEFKVGDAFTVRTKLANPGRGRERYAITVTVRNVSQDLKHQSSMSLIANRFENFEYTIVCN